MGLHELREVEELDGISDDDDDDGADERTHLRNGHTPKSAKSLPKTSASASRSHSHSPIPLDSSRAGDVRLHSR